MFHDLIQPFKDLGLYALMVAALIKVVTSIAVALDAKQFNWSEFGEVFRKDFLRLVVVSGIIILYPNDATNTIFVTAYIAYLTARTAANVGSLFPEFGDVLPDSFKGRTPADSPPLSPQVGTDKVAETK